MFELPDIDDVIAVALHEDLGESCKRFLPGAEPRPSILERDVTGYASVPAGARLDGHVVAREDLVVAGLPVADRVYETLATAAGQPYAVEFFPLVAEGTSVTAGTRLAEIKGDARIVLAGERTALNFLMVLSGIASEAHRWQEAAGDRLAIVDTRKTYPGLRTLSKYASAVGGATNHRSGLWDMILVKDNHLLHVGIADAVNNARVAHPDLEVEVEADTIEQAIAAVRAGADLVLLDNMDDGMLREAVDAVRAEADLHDITVLTEASGGVTFDRLARLRGIPGLDRVSSSAVTMAHPKDIALDASWEA